MTSAKLSFIIATIICMVAPLLRGQAEGNYQMIRSVIDNGGGLSRGANYELLGSITSDPVSPSIRNSQNYTLYGGFLGQFVDLPLVGGIQVGRRTASAVEITGNIQSDGGDTITEAGVVYAVVSVNANPLLGGLGVTKVTTPSSPGVFNLSLSSLQPETSYVLKAYATNSQGTSYTSAGTFTTFSSNADLSALALSSGTLSPSFATGTTAYTASVSNATISITVTPILAQSNASLEARINGSTYAALTSGSPSSALLLNEGSNIVDIRVTAQDGVTQKTYSVMVIRMAAPNVNSSTATFLTATGATLGGHVESDNGAAITERGVVYSATSTNADPLIGGSGVTRQIVTGTTGALSVSVTGLIKGTSYSYKAYAINSLGTTYTSVATFTTPRDPSDGSVIVRLTGSSAYRSATHHAIVQMYDFPPVAGYAGSSLSEAGRSFFYGTIGGTRTIITTSWSGSVGGVQVVTGALPVNFLADTLADSGQTALAVTGATEATGGTQISSSSTFGTNAQVPDIAMSDISQISTPFNMPLLTSKRVGVLGFAWVVNRGLNSDMVSKSNVTTTNGSAVISMADVTGIVVGMNVKGTSVPVNYVKVLSVNASANTVTLSQNAIADSTTAALTFAKAAPFTNINTQQAQALWGAGAASLAQFTGSAADADKLVYATGRDADSGARLNAFAESGIGVESTVTQYRPTVVNGVITALTPYPEQTVNGITYTQGNGGEANGSTLSAYLGHVSTPGLILSYLDSADMPTAVNAGAVELTYNGVAYSVDAVKEGRYTFWGYQHLMYQPTLDAAKKTVADALAAKITTVTAPIKLMDMKCSRTTDGAAVFHD